ncbi:7107_t:CDS:2, partial [Dentiscutata heterogama]
ITTAIEQEALTLLDVLLLLNGKSLKDFSNMPIPPENSSNTYNNEDALNQLIQEERSYNITKLENKLNQNLSLLNDDQHVIFNAITQTIEHEKKDRNYLVVPGTENKIELPLDIVILDEKLSNLIDFLFPDFIQQSTNMDYLIERTILTSKNDNASKISYLIIDKFPGDIHTYLSTDSIDSQEDDDIRQSHLYPPEFPRSLNISILLPGSTDINSNLFQTNNIVYPEVFSTT